MARIRSLKPEMPADVTLARCSRDARLTFVYAITQADDHGLLPGGMRALLGLLYPHDEDVGPAELQRWIGELVAAGLVRERRCRDGAPVLELVGWAKHQRIDNRGRSAFADTLVPLAADPDEPSDPPAEVRGEIPRVAADRGNPPLGSRILDLGEGSRTKDHGEGAADDAGASPRVALDADRVVSAWNEAATVAGYARVTAVTGKRTRALAARLREKGWVERALAAIAFLRDDTWYRQNPTAARFDVLLRPGKAEEYVERAGVARRSAGVAQSRGGARAAVDAELAARLEADPTLGRVDPAQTGGDPW